MILLLPEWTDTNDPNFKCRKCKSSDIAFYNWTSSDEAHDDVHYMCKNCKNDWWVEGSDY